MPQRRILVIDDEAAVRFGVRDYFGRLGYHVDCAAEVEQAKALLCDNRYEVVLVDLCLEGDDADERLLLAQLARERHPASRVIVLTGYRSAAAEAHVRRVGVDLLLYEPQPLPELERIISGVGSAVPGDALGG